MQYILGGKHSKKEIHKCPEPDCQILVFSLLLNISVCFGFSKNSSFIILIVNFIMDSREVIKSSNVTKIIS